MTLQAYGNPSAEHLALFYRDFGYSRGLVRLGRIEGDVEGLAGSDPVTVTIEQLAAVAH